jgi:hypothetical protein
MAYEIAKVRRRLKYVRYVILDEEENTTGVTVYLCDERKGRLIPFCSSLVSSKRKAKKECFKDYAIKDSGWIRKTGEPEFKPEVLKAVEKALTAYCKYQVKQAARKEKVPRWRRPSISRNWQIRKFLPGKWRWRGHVLEIRPDKKWRLTAPKTLKLKEWKTLKNLKGEWNYSVGSITFLDIKGGEGFSLGITKIPRKFLTLISHDSAVVFTRE